MLVDDNYCRTCLKKFHENETCFNFDYEDPITKVPIQTKIKLFLDLDADIMPHLKMCLRCLQLLDYAHLFHCICMKTEALLNEKPQEFCTNNSVNRPEANYSIVVKREIFDEILDIDSGESPITENVDEGLTNQLQDIKSEPEDENMEGFVKNMLFDLADLIVDTIEEYDGVELVEESCNNDGNNPDAPKLLDLPSAVANRLANSQGENLNISTTIKSEMMESEEELDELYYEDFVFPSELCDINLDNESRETYIVNDDLMKKKPSWFSSQVVCERKIEPPQNIVLSCRKCSCIFPTVDELQCHKLIDCPYIFHPIYAPTEKTPYQCERCERYFPQATNVKRHRNRNTDCISDLERNRQANKKIKPKSNTLLNYLTLKATVKSVAKQKPNKPAPDKKNSQKTKNQSTEKAKMQETEKSQNHIDEKKNSQATAKANTEIKSNINGKIKNQIIGAMRKQIAVKIKKEVTENEKNGPKQKITNFIVKSKKDAIVSSPEKVEKCARCTKTLRSGIKCKSCSTWFHFLCAKRNKCDNIKDGFADSCKKCKPIENIKVEQSDNKQLVNGLSSQKTKNKSQLTNQTSDKSKKSTNIVCTKPEPSVSAEKRPMEESPSSEDSNKKRSKLSRTSTQESSVSNGSSTWQTSEKSTQKNQCSACDLSFSSEGMLNIHLRLHNTIHKCEKCDKRFLFEKDFNAHIQWHDSMSCKFCNKEFNSLSKKEQHTKKHITDKGYVCLKCNNEFVRPFLLLQHSC